MAAMAVRMQPVRRVAKVWATAKYGDSANSLVRVSGRKAEQI
jgi:hypothetical protein